jgi:hypothetical protein
MAYLAEHLFVKEGRKLDQAQEDIDALAINDKMIAIACLGRLHLPSALSTLASSFHEALPKLQSIWQANGVITPEALALLIEVSLLIKFLGNLLTGETTLCWQVMFLDPLKMLVTWNKT